MKWLLERAIPCSKIFELATSFDDFEKWLKKEHNITFDDKIFPGYKYFLECAFSSIFDSIANDNSLNIKSDFLFNRVLGQVINIEKLPNTCEKTILLKNIYSFYKPVDNSCTYKELKENISQFNQEVITIINNIYSECYSLNKSFKIDRKLATELIVIEALYILFNQIKNNGPVAYEGQLLKEWWPSNEKRAAFLMGYALTVQFVWYKVLGEKKYREIHIQNIHKSDSWKDYTYNKTEQSEQEDYLSSIFNQTFDIEKQTCFDSYFYWLRDELIKPLEIEYEFFLKHNIELFKIHNKGKVKEYFSSLLNIERAKQEKLSLEEELDMLLFWYPVEIANSDTGSMHSGIPSLITLMAGTAHLLNNVGEFNKVFVSKFIHPLGEGSKKDYSYGILIDTKASAGHYSSGWMLFFDCCGDYSGFSGSEQRKVEELIKSFQKEKIVHLSSMTISKEDFKNYIAKYLPASERISNVSETQILFKSLDKITLTKELNSFIEDARGLVLELLSYYAISKCKDYDKFNVKEWGVDKDKKEIDILLKNNDEAIIIECKVNINNGSLEEHISKAKNKEKEKCAGKKSHIEFWCWFEPSTQSIRDIHSAGCEYKSLCTDNKLPFREHLKLKKTSKILNFIKTNKDFFEKQSNANL